MFLTLSFSNQTNWVETLKFLRLTWKNVGISILSSNRSTSWSLNLLSNLTWLLLDRRAWLIVKLKFQWMVHSYKWKTWFGLLSKRQGWVTMRHTPSWIIFNLRWQRCAHKIHDLFITGKHRFGYDGCMFHKHRRSWRLSNFITDWDIMHFLLILHPISF